ncbi:MAG: iron-containing alcohol dehydrogenase [Lentisphaeria bacterium]|nr:iron-containing alcohol dehydrogenase [Lentisphaeria bacterium]
MKFEMTLPHDIRFGRMCRKQLPPLLPPGPVLFVCGNHAKKRIAAETAELARNRKVVIASAEPGEPSVDAVDRLLETARREQVTGVVGWGGGSAMDSAKAVAALVKESRPAADHFYGRAAAQARSTFLALLPTTAGTGAEVTANAVLTDKETKIKQSLRTPGMTADAALVDPELISECPPSVMAASGFDALTQAVESFISRKADALTRSFARTAARDIFFNLAGACSGDPAAVDAVSLGSLNAGIALSKSGLGAVHGIGHPAGSLLGIPHGVCCAVLLVEVLKFNLPAARDGLDELASALGARNACDLIDRISALRQKLGVPGSFRPFGLKREHFGFIIGNCRSGSMKSNPRDMSDDEAAILLEKLV